MLKFQVPSPYHIPSAKAAHFCIKPYLEIFRLIRDFGFITFDELKIFVLQLVDYHNYDLIVDKINLFRKEKALNKGRYRKFIKDVFIRELMEIYAEEIANKRTKTRETTDASLGTFLKTKAQNMRDYADACFRYLRATGVVSISKGKSISIISDKLQEVDYFLSVIDREPCYVDDIFNYIKYLTNPDLPTLYTDDKEQIISMLRQKFPSVPFDENLSVRSLKELLNDCIEKKKEQIIENNICEIKDKKLYAEIDETFSQIVSDDIYEPSLMLEWNTWRALTMIDGGDIKANLSFDDFGEPLATAQGNMADIECEYDEFRTIVEVTMASGQCQYEMEGEPVARHLAKIRRKDAKKTFCLFIAPNINPACLAQFFILHKVPIAFYGGVSNIIPLELSVFRKMLEDSYRASYTPSSKQLYLFFEKANTLALSAKDEVVWYEGVKELALNWLA